MLLSVSCFLWMVPNSFVHGQSWQDQKLTKRTKWKSSIKVSTAAIDRIRLVQKSSLSYPSKSFREMPSYTKFMYFIIHQGPRVWVFSALHYCCYLGDQASTSLPSSTAQKALTQLVPTQPLFEHRLHAHLLNISHQTVLNGTTKPTQLLQEIKIHPASVTKKKQSHISKGNGKVIYGAAGRTAPRCSTSILNTNFSHPFALQVWDQWEALGRTVSPQKEKLSLTMQNTWS